MLQKALPLLAALAYDVVNVQPGRGRDKPEHYGHKVKNEVTWTPSATYLKVSHVSTYFPFDDHGKIG